MADYLLLNDIDQPIAQLVWGGLITVKRLLTLTPERIQRLAHDSVNKALLRGDIEIDQAIKSDLAELLPLVASKTRAKEEGGCSIQ